MDPIDVQLIRSSLLYASEEMGLALRNASYSPNIKERMDHSAAIFDARGRLLSQAEHIPVHLGSLPWGLGRTIEYCRRERIDFEEGSVVVVNDPYLAGTHLNDVTAVTPIFGRGELLGFAANKAHHSDLGGKVPGSISIDSRTIFEEGLVVEPTYLVRNGRFVEKTLSLFSSGSRTPEERLGDLRAQVAANVTGARRVVEVVRKFGRDGYLEAAEESFRYSERMMRSRLGKMRAGSFTAEDYLEGPGGEDIRLRAKVTISKDGVLVDYSGTHQQVDYPLNAVFGVTLSGAYFVVRVLTGDDIPANYGAFAPIKVIAPEGCLLNPTFPHPVGGGNVETSQRNADLVFRAFSKVIPERCPAASGGSMNNVMMGGTAKGRSWAFYETIGVGLGGRRGMDGIDGIQANMTNTMNTPIEEIERTLPMLVTTYEFRPDSGGPGQFRGGNGLIRSFQMLGDSTTFTILAERERFRPWGLLGGKDGEAMKAVLVRQGKPSQVPNKGTYVLKRGEEFQVHTAGGGGFGNPHARARAKVRSDVESGLISRESAAKSYGYKVGGN
jgi:N-methylhydantoinase B